MGISSSVNLLGSSSADVQSAKKQSTSVFQTNDSPQINTPAQNDAAIRFLADKASAKNISPTDIDDGAEKTAADFYNEILKEQPFDFEKLDKKKVSVALEMRKSPERMTLADYEQAKNRAIFKQAGYGMLTDDELEKAVSLIKSNGSITDNNFGLDNLRRLDKKSAQMFVGTTQASIEIAKRAGQAVLQYQEYKAKQADANREKAQNEVNQMFADQARVLWNSAVNIAEGAVNTALDAATTNGGANPLPLLNPNRPQADFSGAKADYRSEMMRRDLNGKLDGDGIKAGQFIETGVTVLAPFVIGAATAPKAAPQSLKSLGGIPEVEVSTATTQATNAAKTADASRTTSAL